LGKHYGEHAAGQVLTAVMADARHGVESFADFPMAGVLADFPGLDVREKA
jgi:predicted heme/steroid binding protein